jgi:hypothetical protein
LEPPATTKRKRTAAVVDDIDSDSAKENIGTKKKAKTQPKAVSKAAPKKTTTPKAAPKNANSAKSAKTLYTETLKAIDRRVNELDKKVKAMSGNSTAITTASYATSVGKHMPAVKKLAAMDPILAFNLLLSMTDASHTDLDASMKMCGTPCDSSGPTFAKLDEALLPLIVERAAAAIPPAHEGFLPEVPHRWTRKDADVGPFKCGYPNKQQRNQMYAQKLQWEKERREARRQRREEVDDWVAVALSDLKEERDYIEQYGVEGYLPKCIVKLEGMRAGI